MKKYLMALILACALTNSGKVLADPISVTGSQIPVAFGLEIEYHFGFDYWIRSVPKDVTKPYDPGTSDVTSSGLNFNDFEWDEENKIYASNKYFVVYISPYSNATPGFWRFTQSCSGITNETGQNLNKTLVMTPFFSRLDLLDTNGDGVGDMPQQGIPENSDNGFLGPTQLGKSCLAYGSNKLVFQSRNGYYMFRCHYGLATGNKTNHEYQIDPVGAEPITANQRAGTYRGTITFTLTIE